MGIEMGEEKINRRKCGLFCGTGRAVCKITRARLTHWYKKTRLVYIHTYARSNANISTRLKVYNFQRCLHNTLLCRGRKTLDDHRSTEYCTVHVRRRIWTPFPHRVLISGSP